MKKPFVFIILLVVIFAVITACALPGFVAPGPVDPNSLSTAVMETQQFAQTQDAFSTLVAQATAVAQGTLSFPTATATSGEVPGTGPGTAQPSATPTGPTALPTLTRFPSMTPMPTLTRMPVVIYTSTPPATLTSAPAPSVRAEFVSDVTVPDGMKFYPNEVFTKVWRLKNTGTATWTSTYSVVFEGGTQMDGPSPIDFGTEVKPGQMVDISVNMKSPGSKGAYTGRWMLRTNSGVKFYLSNGGPMTAKIEVVDRPNFGSNVVYNFVVNFCRATWATNGGEKVLCPTLSTRAHSSVYRLLAPKLEGGYQDDEPALVMVPKDGDDGLIRGLYPAFDVQSGDTFHAVVGCLDGAPRCDVKMQLAYSINGAAGVVLATWDEVSDGKYHAVSAPLSSLAGKKVQFILRVSNEDDVRDDKAFWLAPRIVRSAAPANTAPVLANITAKTVNEGSQLSFTATATDAEGQALTYSLGSGAPAGASITAAGVFTWTPTEAQGPGNYTARVIVSDGSLTDHQDVAITVNEVNNAPVLAPIGPKSVNEGAQLSFTATATDPEGQTLTYSLQTPPAGASITQNTGVFTWTPTAAQGPNSYTVRVIVSDGSLTDSEDVVITVNEVNTAPVLAAIGSKTVNEGEVLTFTASATDAEGHTLTYSLGGSGPSGAAITPAGVFTWTPSEVDGPGSFTVTVIVSDGSLTDSEDVDITVDEVNQAPSITSPGNRSNVEGAAVNLQIAASDADLPANTLSFEAVGLPEGLTINGSGLISGTIAVGAALGSPYEVTVTVDDGVDLNSVTFNWDVTEAP